MMLPFAITNSRKRHRLPGDSVSPEWAYAFNLLSKTQTLAAKLFSRLQMGIKCSHYRGQLRLR
ncbi:hypothetical protein KCP74_18005 [Salmonella enterica subsp. enterica]|nr:hypothetical protein KCP74_18005 [Salmonella enterica subsp. enterica]